MTDRRSAMEKRMKTCQSMTIGTLLTAAGLLASAYTTTAYGVEAEATATPAANSDIATSLDFAADLIADKKVVKAKSVLAGLLSRSDLSDRERARVTTLMSRASVAVNNLDASELSIQSAENAVEAGELLAAERHANMVLKAAKATNEQSERARVVIAAATERRTQIQSSASELLATAKSAFEAGRFTESRASLRTLANSGADLSEEQVQTLAMYQTKLVELSEQTAAAGMLAEQPGVVKPREEQPDAPKPVEPEVTSQPKAPAPEVTAQGGARQPAPSGDEMIRQAQRVEAQAILAEAEQAFNDRRLNEAVSKFSRVKTQYRDFLSADQLTKIDNRLAECRALLGTGGGGDILETNIKQRDAIRQETIAVFESNVAQAMRSMETGAWDDARVFAANAQLKVNQNRNVLNESEFQALTKRYEDLKAAISLRQEQARTANVDDVSKRIAEEESQNRLAASQAREKKINESLARIRALQQEMKYEEAIQVCDNILFLDPINPSALVLREVISDALIYTRMGAAQNRARQEFGKQSADNQEAMITETSLVTYPGDWEQLSARRGGVSTFQDSPENRRTLAMLQNKKTPVKFKDNSLGDVLNFVQAVTNVNMDIDWASLEVVGVDKDRPVSLELTNVSVTTVLDRVMEKVSDDPTNGAAWAVYDGVLTIESREQLNRKTKLQIYDIRDLLINVPNFTNMPEFDLQQALQSRGRGGGGGGQSPFRQNQQNNQENQGPTLEERTDELVRIITENVDRDTWVDNGGSVGKIQRFQGNLIVTQTPNNHRLVDGLLGDLRKFRAVQINVETRFLLVQQNWFEQIGLDLDVYFNAKNNQVRAARGFAPQTTARDFFNFRQGGYQGGVVTPVEVDVNRDGDTTDPNESGNPLFAGAPSPLSPVSGEGNSLGLAESLIGGDLASNILQSGPALGIAGSFLDDIQVDFLVKATQADTRSTTLTAPRITLMNGQISNFYVVVQNTYVSDLTPVTSDSAVGFDPQVDVTNEGVVMMVEGLVSADRRYVTLTIDSAISRSGEVRRLPITAVAGGQLVNSAETSSFIELPVSTVTRVQTTVSVPDQGTILMGGQRLITEQEVETGVPVLSKIPFLNRFFTNRLQVKEEQTLLILVKPTVIIQNEQEELAFPGAAEKIRTGGW
jgi:type II secretory pathway component GspD/PulD (secretin)